MVIELRPKATISLPKEIAKEFKLSTGDKLELVVEDGVIKLTPVYVVKKTLIKEIKTNVNKIRKATGDKVAPELASLDDVMTKIEEK